MLHAKRSNLARTRTLVLAAVVSFLGAVSALSVDGSDRSPGAQVFQRQCVACHGANGEGTAQYPKALVGTQSVGELAEFIRKTMPPGTRKKLSARQSRDVASHIHDAFYSPIAQARNRPARVELSRLTVGQYRNAVADLVGSFQPAAGAGGRGGRGGRGMRPEQDPPEMPDAPETADAASVDAANADAANLKNGLRGEYYSGRQRRRRNVEVALRRVDPQIDFQFGQATPGPELDDPYQFSIQWEGSLLAPDTGDYEFILRTDQGAGLWVNDLREPLVDARVKSGDDTEFRGTVFLLGGRQYPVRMEFSKLQQGVDNQELLRSTPPGNAFISLAWKAPHRIVEVIPERNLFPRRVPETFVVASRFPPDDRSVGYERGTTISRAWNEASTDAALEVAAHVADRLPELADVPEDAGDREQKLRAFCRDFVTRAFRRPLSAEQQQFFVDRQFETTSDIETAVRRVVLLTLKSPRFLYHSITSEPGKPDPYDVASQLSFGLWDSLPDPELLAAAESGELVTREQIVRQAERLVSDPRAWFKLRDFLLNWLHVEHNPEMAKDGSKFPEFDAHAAADLRTSLELFLEHVVWGERSDFREMLLTDQVFLNGRLARIYGVDLEPEAPFQRVPLDPGRRSGVLTHPYVMANFSYLDSSSPIHRGVLIARSMLGRVLMPPPEAFTPVPAELHPDMTTRERVAMQTKPDACMSCHDLINPLGFTLEHFDAIGRFRQAENGRWIRRAATSPAAARS
jgi:cytochrome c553